VSEGSDYGRETVISGSVVAMVFTSALSAALNPRASFSTGPYPSNGGKKILL